MPRKTQVQGNITVKIYIPSMGRAFRVDEGPLSQIPERWRNSVRYVVPPDEMERYRAALKGRANVLGCDAKGIASTRHWIGRFAEDDKFIMMDDDVRFVVRESTESTKLRQIRNNDDVDDMLTTIVSLLDEHAHVGISTRQGNNNLGVGLYDALNSYNTRTLRVLAYRKKEFLAAEHGRVEVMEDFDVNLQLLGMGHSNCNVGWWAQDQKMTNAPGGCSLYRTHEVHERSARRLAELHPGVVSLREKKNKTGGEFGTRTEVTILWKKKYAQSQRKVD
jgi:hypothetical protein